MHELGPVLLVVLGVSVAGLLARRTGIPSPVLLVLGGLAVTALPGVTTLTLDPEVVLVVVLPPLLYSAALDASLLDFRRQRAPDRAARSAWSCSPRSRSARSPTWSCPACRGRPRSRWARWSAPPDAVAAIAIGRRVGMPAAAADPDRGRGPAQRRDRPGPLLGRRAAARGGDFSVPHTAGLLVLAAAGGLLVGLAVAWVLIQVRRRLEEPLVENVLSLATPFLAYLPAEQIHASGVLAVVVCGLVLGHSSPTLLSSTSRLQTQPTWKVVTFLLEGGVFLVIGLQLPDIVDGLGDYGTAQLAGYAVAVVLTVLLSRPLWIVPSAYLPRRFSSRLRAQDPVHWSLHRGAVLGRDARGGLAGGRLRPAAADRRGRRLPPPRPAAVPRLRGHPHHPAPAGPDLRQAAARARPAAGPAGAAARAGLGAAGRGERRPGEPRGGDRRAALRQPRRGPAAPPGRVAGERRLGAAVRGARWRATRPRRRPGGGCAPSWSRPSGPSCCASATPAGCPTRRCGRCSAPSTSRRPPSPGPDRGQPV